MTQIISQLALDKNGIYKQTTLKSLDAVNYDLKGATILRLLAFNLLFLQSSLG